MNTESYLPDKPKNCQQCYFWKKRKQCCGLGENNCYYSAVKTKNVKTECDGCPYGRDHPCIGFYMKKVMREVGLTK